MPTMTETHAARIAYADWLLALNAVDEAEAKAAEAYTTYRLTERAERAAEERKAA